MWRPIRAEFPRCGGRQIHEGAKGVARPASRAQLEHLSGENESNDDGGGFEIEVVGAPSMAGASRAIMLKAHAASVPMAMRVNMFGERCTSDIQARRKKGHPHQKSTGVARKA